MLQVREQNALQHPMLHMSAIRMEVSHPVFFSPITSVTSVLHMFWAGGRQKKPKSFLSSQNTLKYVTFYRSQEVFLFQNPKRASFSRHHQLPLALCKTPSSQRFGLASRSWQTYQHHFGLAILGEFQFLLLPKQSQIFQEYSLFCGISLPSPKQTQ